jgi:uncharacterized protein (UPF0332 family)
LATESERYLRKAHESLASAEAELEAGRHNSAANRAYYAAFQAAVAALIYWQVRAPGTEWQHRFVQAEFAVRLINRRKVFSADLRSSLEHLFKLRIKADYESIDVPAKSSTRAVGRAHAFVSALHGKINQATAGEPQAEYNVTMQTAARDPLDLVEGFKSRIRDVYSDVDFKVIQRAERDFTIKVYGDYEDMDEVVEILGNAPTDALTEHDAWIVVIGLERHLLDH